MCLNLELSSTLSGAPQADGQHSNPPDYLLRQSFLRMQIAHRVRVFNRDGDHVFLVHEAQARRMLNRGQAERRCSGRKVQALTLIGSLAQIHHKPPTQPTNRTYMGQAYTFIERLELARVTAFKHLADEDRPIFIASILDNLVST